MVKLLFVCHGNICRSPMAEFVMKDLVEKAGLQKNFHIGSAATSTEEIGNPVYPPARPQAGRAWDLLPAGTPARQLTRSDYGAYDLLIGMDRANLRNMERICGGDPDGKIHLLLEYADHPGQEVADPWYTGDFEATWQDVLAGVHGAPPADRGSRREGTVSCCPGPSPRSAGASGAPAGRRSA